jgi:uncharacterized membrane protein
MILVFSAFLASAVEAVEALTVVLAAGTTRGWRPALIGAGAAILALAAAIAVLGPSLSLMPIDALRVIVGALLVVFGLQWLRKAVLRAGGAMAQRDEAVAFRREQEEAAAAAPEERAGLDWYAFTVSFKGVLLEGLEVVFIVISFGSAQGKLGLAAAGAAAAVVVVVLAGVLVRGPLERVPENTLKYAVGLMLTSFGCFWGAEGAGVDWPGGELSLLVLIAFLWLVSFVLVQALRRRPLPVPSGAEA